MKRETIADLWILGIILLSLSIIMPLSWLEIADKNTDTEKISYSEFEPASLAESDAGSGFAVSFGIAAILVGTFTALGLFRWSLGGKSISWVWGGMTILLVVLAVTSFAGFHSMYGHNDNASIGTTQHILSWSPQDGFYLIIFSISILIIAQYLAWRNRSAAV